MRLSPRATIVATLIVAVLLIVWIGNRFSSKPSATDLHKDAVPPVSRLLRSEGQAAPIAAPAPLAAATKDPIPQAGRPVAAAWTLTSPTEGLKLDSTSAAFKISQVQGKPIKGRSAHASALSLLQLEALRQGDTLQLPLLDGGSTLGVVQLVAREETGWLRVSGVLSGEPKGSFVLASNGKTFDALLQLPQEGIAYRLEKQRDGQTLLVEQPLSDVVCYALPRFEGGDEVVPGDIRVQAVPPILSSRPSATAVVYLDFDGEVVTDPAWNNGNTINAAASPLTESQMTEVWNRVKEDYWPFNIDVTTSLSRYTGAPVGKRMRCIITPTNTAAPGAGGVAFLRSFAQAGTGFYTTTIPCWVFNNSAKSIAEAISHELGHAFGLQHDGRLSPLESYYDGHGSGAVSWGPIMGAPYTRELTQWSKGEYANADQVQDDVAVIASQTNSFGYISDEAGGTRASAANMPAPGGNINFSGVITQASDVDFYSMNVPAGRITVNAAASIVGANLDIFMELQDSNGAVLATSNPDFALDASISLNVGAGLFFLKIQGAGRGDVLGTGYSSYGSIGAYRLTGSLPGTGQAPVITSAASVSAVANQSLSFQLTADNSPTSFGIAAGTLPTGLTLNTATGLITGSPLLVGVTSVTVSATNSVGVGTKVMTFSVSPLLTLAQALDATALTWTTTGNQVWQGQTATTFDGTDAAQSGAIGSNQSSRLTTTVTGPSTVSFRWRVDSESGYDFLRFYIDSVSQSEISGRSNWELKSFNVPAGTHTLEWRYTKDETVNEGVDAGWVDVVTVSAPLPPTITSAAAVPGTVGQSLNYQIVATNSPASYQIVAGTLPAGLSLSTTSGLVSGVPTAQQTSTVTFGATNSGGTGTLAVTFSISGASIPLATALDTSTLTWNSGGNAVFFGQTQVTFDGVDAARSGQVGNTQQSWMETTVTGPAVITFRWRVDSEEGYDYLSVRDNGTTVAAISGFRDWFSQSVSVTAGSHTLRWVYDKDGSRAVGADAGWVDTVTVSTALTRGITLGGDLAFGNVPVGTTATRTLVLTNTGNSVLTVSNIAYPNGFSGAFSGTIDPGASRSVTVSFSPIAAASYSGAITISSDATGGSTTRAISGVGSFPAPQNDTLANALTLTGNTASGTGNTSTATRETGEPLHDGIPGGKSIWWRWTAPASGTVAVNTIGSAFDTLLAVYTGTSLANLVAVASDDESGGNGTSALAFNASVGVTYWIAVDGFLGDFGDVTLHLSQLPAQAPNNAFASATTLTGSVAQSIASNAGATREVGEPNPGNQAIGRTLWWTWTAPGDGRLLVDTNGSTPDTIMAVYTGSQLNALTLLKFDDDGGYMSNSAVAITVQSGVTYRILVDGFLGETGVITLNLQFVTPPINDNFANAATLSGTSVQVTSSNLGASKETGEPNHAGFAGGSSVWWRWVAPSATRVNLTTSGSHIDTLLAVYIGSAVNGLSLVASNDEASPQVSTSALSFNAAAGTTYYVALDGFAAAGGDVTLKLTAFTPATNDSYSSATTITGAHLQLTASNLGATREAGEPNHAGEPGGASVWWRWVAPAAGNVSLSTAGSDFDTLLGVYTGNSINGLTLIASNDEDGPLGVGVSALNFGALTNTTYWIAVDGYAGETGTIALALNADIFVAPTITTQPVNLTVTAGQSAQFTVVADGSAPLSYQWRKDGAPITGATGPTHAIASAEMSNAGAYSVVVSNSVGSVTSASATLTVNSGAVAPAITTQPLSQTVTVGQDVTFTVTATGTAPLTYQWRKDNVPITGATNASLTLNAVQLAAAGAYSVVVTNSVGNVTSNAATLTVSSAPVAPFIIGQPVAQTVTAGQTASFTVIASGTAPFTFQWRKNGVSITGATNATLTLSNAQASDVGAYSVVVGNGAGSVTSNSAALTVNATAVAPVITTQPANQTVMEGQAATFSVVATGTAPLAFQWRKDGVALSGATADTLTLLSTQASQAGAYSVVVSNTAGSVTSSAATLSVQVGVASRISNVSVRTTLAANQSLTVGFTMIGGSKSIVVRAVGPGLAEFNVSGTMPDPKMTLFDGNAQIDANDNWGGFSSLSTAFASVGAFALPPSSLDAALLRSIEGGRTVQVNGTVGGNVLVEAYDAAPGNAIRFVNVSSRNRVGTGADLLVAGFTILGTAPKTVLIRAIGPTLSGFGVPDVLTDPKLEVFSGETKINENDNWPASLATTFAQVSAFPLGAGSKDAAIVLTLQPGGYTVQVSGADGGTGEGMVEIYEVQP